MFIHPFRLSAAFRGQTDQQKQERRVKGKTSNDRAAAVRARLSELHERHVYSSLWKPQTTK